MSKPRAEVSLRFSFGKQYPALDQRTVRLLELIEEHGSIRNAALVLKIGYRTAWTLISNLNRCGQGAIVNAKCGGSLNGSRLTPLGRALVTQFRRTEWALSACIDRVNADLHKG